jgi:hypothetical protein
VKIVIKYINSGKIAAKGVVAKNGTVEWDATDDSMSYLLQTMPIPPNKDGHYQFVRNYINRSTTMMLVEVK